MNTEALLKLADWLESGELGGQWEFGEWGSTGRCGTSGCAIGLGALGGMLPGVRAKVLSSCMVFEYEGVRSIMDGVAAAAKAFDISWHLAYDLFATVPDEAYDLAVGSDDLDLSAHKLTTPQMIAERIRDVVGRG
jgi:hypothetical protein